MKNYLGRLILLVKDYDEALTFYTKNFDCKVLFDTIESNGERYLHIGFDASLSVGIWFLKASSEEALKRVGNQTAGEPAMVIYTDSVEDLYRKLRDNKVIITKNFITADEYSFFHCLDLYGNEIVVVGSKNNQKA